MGQIFHGFGLIGLRFPEYSMSLVWVCICGSIQVPAFIATKNLVSV